MAEMTRDERIKRLRDAVAFYNANAARISQFPVDDVAMLLSDLDRLTREKQEARWKAYRDGYLDGMMQPSNTVETDIALAEGRASRYTDLRATLPTPEPTP